MSNHTTLSQFIALDAKQRQAIPPVDYSMIADEITALKRQIECYSTALHDTLHARFGDMVQQARREKGADTGSLSFWLDGCKLAHELPKRVEWNEDGLRAVAKMLRDQGEPVDDYISVRLGVDERKWNAWPETIKEFFRAHRTVKTGKPVYKVEV